MQEVQVVVGDRGRRVLVFGFIFTQGKIAGGVEIGELVGMGLCFLAVLVCPWWRSRL